MTTTRWNWIPIILVLCGATAEAIVAIANWRTLGWWQALLYGGLILAVAALFWFRRKLTATEQELEVLREQLRTEEADLERERHKWKETRQQFEIEIQQQAARLDKREQGLAQRFVTYHEWMEFPKPVDLVQQPAASDIRLAELVRKDRQMHALLKEETQKLYDNILANRYVAEGTFQPDVLFNDMRALMTRVARIYEPNSEHPLLETSLPRIIRSASRACLQLLVVLDELPLNVKEYNINKMASNVRRAVQAYRMYKSTEPYWPFVNTAYYLSRFAMGTNPLTLGAWWFIGSLGQRGATALAQHVINRQILTLIASVVRIIGYEVAGLYGGDFRHRDANWIFAVELSELVSRFPMSRDSLSHALREVGALQLRSEYDRVYLYRCLAAHASALKEEYRSDVILTPDERQAIASRLERFFETFIHGKTSDRVSKWKQGAEERLGLKLTAWQPTATSSADQRFEAVHSLASFLIGVKEREPDEVLKLLADSHLLRQMDHAEQAQLFTQLHDQPPYFFEHPDIDPESELATQYLDELVALHVQLPPRESQVEAIITDAAAYLRKDQKYVRALLDKHFSDALAERLPKDVPGRKAPRHVARAVLDLLPNGERARFVYGGVSLDWPARLRQPPEVKGDPWLLGVDDRLVLFTTGSQPRVLWRGEEPLRTEVVRGYVTGYCRVMGGQWVADRAVPSPQLRIAAPLVGSTTGYFAPLLEAVHAPRLAGDV